MTFNARQDGDKEKNVRFLLKARGIWANLKSVVFFLCPHIANSVAYSLETMMEHAILFLPGAKGNWEISKYNLNGIVTRSLINNKLLIPEVEIYGWQLREVMIQNGKL